MKLDNSWRNTAECETLARSDIAEGKLVAGRTNSAPSNKCTNVRKQNIYSKEMY